MKYGSNQVEKYGSNQVAYILGAGVMAVAWRMLRMSAGGVVARIAIFTCQKKPPEWQGDIYAARGASRRPVAP